jgi:uncharacterized coiled-coil protein SlyX
MDAMTRTYARRKNVHQKAAAKPVAVPAAEESAPSGLALQSLLSLVGQIRNIAPDGSGTALNPKLILTGSGLEIRFSGAGAATAAAAESPEAEESPDRLARMERTLKLLSTRISRMDASVSQSIIELEAQLGSQCEAVDSLRAAVQQNEDLLETLADSMNIVDDLGQPDLGPELVLGPTTIAS